MHIGFYLNDMVGSLTSKSDRNVLGEEILARGIASELSKIDGIESAEIYSRNKLPDKKLDFMIYMNFISYINPNWADKNIVYFQNSYSQNGDLEKIYKKLRKEPYDAILVYSKKLEHFFKDNNEKVYFYPFCVNTDVYKQTEYDKNFDYDVTFVGNDIKGARRTKKFLLPAINFDFGLFGNWQDYSKNYTYRKISKYKCFDRYNFAIYMKKIKKLFFERTYKKKLSRISKGRISQNNMIKLLSSSKIVLNFTHQYAVDWDVMNYRILEILACGGFCLTDKVPVVEKELQGCVAFSDGGKDMKRKIQYYLEHDEERKAIAKKGHEYFLKHYTAKAKAEELISILKQI